MLISHRNKFIYTKTVKTASTSVESFFEPFCMEDGEWSFSDGRDMHISNAGIIGMRASLPKNVPWFNHMSAISIKKQLNPHIWDDYFKFTVIRNPFDKILSGYTMFSRIEAGGNPYLRKLARRFKFFAPKAQALTPSQEVQHFRTWLKGIAADLEKHQAQHLDDGIAHFELPIALSIFDQDKYMIDGECCVDDFIRFEFLSDDIAKVCNRLDIEMSQSTLPELKMGGRKQKIAVSDYYDAESEAFVRDLFAWEIKKFNYSMPN